MIVRVFLISTFLFALPIYAQSLSDGFFALPGDYGREEEPQENGNILGKNLHEIYAGEYYRSAQLTKTQLSETINKHGIKTVINLRGAHVGEDWYDNEAAVAKSKGVELIDIGMSASRLPHRQDLIKLLDAFHQAPRPLLVHCQAGADRTGEATAIYLMEFKGKSKNEALKMLTVKYHHLEVAKPAKRYFIDKIYEDETWVRSTYDPCAADYKYYDKPKYCTN